MLNTKMTNPIKLKEKEFYDEKKKNGWVLYTGLYEIKWKNGVADEICIENVILKIKPWKPRLAKKLFA